MSESIAKISETTNSLQSAILRRLEIRERIGNDRYRQALEVARCANDVVFWVNRWCWTYDPRENVKTIPFDMFPRQEAFLRWLADRDDLGEDGIAEKSRDVGFTWLCCGYATHRWLFQEGDSTGFGSRKLDLVDMIGNPDCIFEKIRFLLRNLPAWMLPRGFSLDKNAGYCKILNPANGASITGEGGDDIGRGGRKSRYFVDESAALEHPALVDAALSQTTRVRIDVSTPRGTGNSFYRRRFSGTVPVFTFHWRDDPRKDEVWYEREKARIGDPVIVAQELDIDYTASHEGVCIPALFVRAAVNLFESDAFKAAYPDYVPSGERGAGLDIAEEGKNKNVLVSGIGPLIDTVIDWSQLNTTQTAWKARDEAVVIDVKWLNYDVVGVGAGVKGTWNSAEVALPFATNAVNWGEPPTDDKWPDGKTSKELFVNLRAELAWKLRRRFERTYEFRAQGILHAPDDMISIPNHAALITDLSLELYFRTETGKIQLEAKKDLQRRGVKSPDFKDALAFYTIGKKRVRKLEIV